MSWNGQCRAKGCRGLPTHGAHLRRERRAADQCPIPPAKRCKARQCRGLPAHQNGHVPRGRQNAPPGCSRRSGARRIASARDKTRNKVWVQGQKAALLATLRNQKAASGCVDCGERDPLVLDFDHVGPKEFAISRFVQDRGWRPGGEALLQAEIAKCVVRCANCHRRKTTRGNEYRNRPVPLPVEPRQRQGNLFGAAGELHLVAREEPKVVEPPRRYVPVIPPAPQWRTRRPSS